MLTADQFVGRDNGLLLNNSHAGQPRLSKKSHISPDVKEKSESSATKAPKSKKLRIRNEILDM